LTASALLAKLRALFRTLWCVNARDITEPLHRPRASSWRSQDVPQPLPEFQRETIPEQERERTETQPEPEPSAPVKQPQLRAPPPRRRGPSRYPELRGRHKHNERAEDEQTQDAEREREKEEQETRTKAEPGLTMGCNDAHYTPQLKPVLRPCPVVASNLLDIFRPGEKLPAIFRQIAWLTTVSNLPSKLRTLWRVTAREMTAPHFHSKRPRKAKAPNPF
jgi:hypothetical protein